MLSLPTPMLALNIMMIFILGSLLFPFFTKDRAELVSIVSIYRPFSLFFMILNPIAMLIAPRTTPAVLPIATSAILASMAFFACELRFSRGKPVPRYAFSAILLLFVVVLGSIEILWDFGQTGPKHVGLIAILAAVFFVWICIEATLAYVALRSANYLFVLMTACIAAIAVCVRAKLFMESSYDFKGLMLYGDDDLFLTKSIAAASLLAMTIMLGQLYLRRELKSEIGSRKKAEDSLLSMLSALSLVRDEETGYHIKRTSEFVRILAQELKDRGALEESERHDLVDMMSRVAPLHDIGKIGIPDRILQKPGKLNQDEWSVMKTHSAIGEEVLKAAADVQGDHSGYMDLLMRIAADIAGGHHEHWDGSGYPRGLIGKDIPQAARIMALADVYDALTSPRFYKKPWSHADAVTEIKRLNGSKFDPQVVEAFFTLEENFKQIASKYNDG